MRQDPALIAAAEPYVRTAMWGLVPALWFVVLRNFIAALERPRAGMVVTFLGVGFNALAAYGLIFGAFGLPALGLQGAGIAAALTNLLMFAGLLAYVLIDRQFRRYQVLGRFWRPDWVRFREIFRLGLPIGMTLIMEVGLFATPGYLMGWIGTAELAAHQIALQCASVTFMVPLGLGQAATVRVGLAAGAGDAAGVRRAGIAALVMGGIVHGPDGDRDVDLAGGDHRPVHRRRRSGQRGRCCSVAVAFLGIAALFQIVDGGQVIGAGALRGLKDTRWPMVFAAFAYWVVGISMALGLGFGAGLGGLGIWIGLALALAVAALLMIGRFARPPAPGGRARPRRRPRASPSEGRGRSRAIAKPPAPRACWGRQGSEGAAHGGQDDHHLRGDRQHHQARSSTRTCRSRRRRSPTPRSMPPRPAPRSPTSTCATRKTGAPSMELAHYREVVERIRASATDLIINLTTGPGGRFVPSEDDPKVAAPGSTLVRPERRVEHVVALKPEICSLDLNTMWFGSAVVINTPRNAAIMARAIREAGVMPELEVFDSGDLQLAHQLLADGVLARPPLFQIVLGIRNGFPATPGDPALRQVAAARGRAVGGDGHRPDGVPDRRPGVSARRPRAGRARGQPLPRQGRARALQRRAGRARGHASSSSSARSVATPAEARAILGLTRR